jgi:hypothetical protein
MKRRTRELATLRISLARGARFGLRRLEAGFGFRSNGLPV